MAEKDSLKTSRYTERTPRELVSLARILLCLFDGTSNVLLAIEGLKRFFPRLQILTVDDSLFPEIEAQAYPKQWIIKVRRGIYEGLLRGNSRGRWTLIHELSHVLLQHPGRPARHRHVIENRRTAAGRREREADIVTRSIFMPYDSVSELQFDEIRKISGVSAASAARRTIEIADAKASYKAVRRRSLDISKFTSEFGHRDDIEQQIAVVAHALHEKVRSSVAADQLVEPVCNNLFNTAVLVGASSRLLLDAYRSFKRQTYPEEFISAAVLALSIITIRPLRAADSTGHNELQANLDCAALAALNLVGLPQIDLGAALFLHPVIRTMPYETFFLKDARLQGEQLISNKSAALTLENFPAYELYNYDHDIRWEDIHEIEYLAKWLFNLKITRNAQA